MAVEGSSNPRNGLVFLIPSGGREAKTSNGCLEARLEVDDSAEPAEHFPHSFLTKATPR